MSKVNILVVEDERLIVDLMYRDLESMPGVNVDICGSEEDALKAIRNKSYALAFVDIHLTDDHSANGGINVMQKLKDLREGTSVIVVSGTGHVHATVAAYKTGIVDFIEKPVKDGANVVREMTSKFLHSYKHSQRSLLGNHSSIVSYLAEPEFRPIWESNLAAALGSSIEILNDAVDNALKRRLPLLRIKGDEPAFAVVPGSRSAIGNFWSKAEGSEIRFLLAFPDENVERYAGDSNAKVIHEKKYRNLVSKLWLGSWTNRDSFEEDTWSREVTKAHPVKLTTH